MSLRTHQHTPKSLYAGVLQPLQLGLPDAHPRLRMVLTAMARDLVGRVQLDRMQHGRWPSTQRLQLKLALPGDGAPRSKLASASCGFPAAALPHGAYHVHADLF